MNKQNSKKYYILFSLLTFIVVFYLFPVSLVYFGISHAKEIHQKTLLQPLSNEISKKFLKGERLEFDPSIAWAQAFHNIKLEAENTDNVVELFKQRRCELKNSFEFIIWEKDNPLPSYSPNQPQLNINWKHLWKVINKTTKEGKIRPNLSLKELNLLQEFYGEQITPRRVKATFNSKIRLAWTDSSDKKPLLWGFSTKQSNAKGFLFLKRKNLINSFLLRNYFNNLNKEKNAFKIIISDKKSFTQDKNSLHLKIANFIKSSDYLLKKNIETSDAFYFPHQFEKHIAYALVKKSQLASTWLFEPLYGIFLYSILFLPAFIAFFKLLNAPIGYFISIWKKVGFIFIYAAGLPLLALYIIGDDYLDKMRTNLTDTIKIKGINKLQQFDQNYLIGKAQKASLINQELAELKAKIRTNGMKWQDYRTFIDSIKFKQMKNEFREAFLVSRNGLVFNRFGIIKNKKYTYTIGKHPPSASAQKVDIIGKGFIKQFNAETIPAKESTELELIFDTLFRKSSHKVLTEILENLEEIFLFKWGTETFPTYFNLFSAHPNSSKVSFFMFLLWSPANVQKGYICNQILNANRNTSSFKIVIASNKFNERIYPENCPEQKEILKFSKTVSNSQGLFYGQIKVQEKDYIAAGFKGKNLHFFNLIFLYPLEKIEKNISKQRNELILAGIISILMTIFSGIFLVQMFLVPLNHLNKGINAIEQRNFKFRLDIEKEDEFGKLNQILNNTIIDLEELNVAGLVQQKLLPQDQFTPKNFSVFAKTIPLGDLGGDYYDHFLIDDNYFSMLLGDVAGHGVGAALIMAMAKAGIIHLEHLHNQPAKCLTELHKLILASKGKKQRKFMTMQYFYMDSSNGEAIYANAGGCAPIYYSHSSKTAKELKLQSSALGMFKKATFDEIKVQFEPGDAIVMYSDGIIEAQNSEDEEFGYERLRDLVCECYTQDSKQLYDRIYEAYIKFIGHVPPNDDMTIQIAIYTPEQTQ